MHAQRDKRTPCGNPHAVLAQEGVVLGDLPLPLSDVRGMRGTTLLGYVRSNISVPQQVRFKLVTLRNTDERVHTHKACCSVFVFHRTNVKHRHQKAWECSVLTPIGPSV